MEIRNKYSIFNIQYSIICALLVFLFSYATCKYSTKDTSPIPAEIKTFRVNYLENKARYVNPQLSPQLTERVKQKIIGQTRLRQTNSDDAHYDISGYISDYNVSTSGIANQTASTNRLNVTFHLVFKNTLDQTKDIETDVAYSLDFSAQKTLQDVEAASLDDIIKNLTDAIFNKIFSNW
jgi:hypothetical protein